MGRCFSVILFFGESIPAKARQRTNAPNSGGEETDPSPPQETYPALHLCARLNRHDHTVTTRTRQVVHVQTHVQTHIVVWAGLVHTLRSVHGSNAECEDRKTTSSTGITMHCGAVLAHTLMVLSREQTASARIRRLSNSKETHILAWLRNACSTRHASTSLTPCPKWS